MANKEIKKKLPQEIQEEEELTDKEIEEIKKKRIPWNIVFERNGVFIVLFLVCVLVLFNTVFRIIFNPTMWSIDILAWHIAFIMIYILFAPCIIFFKKILALIPALVLFLCSLCLIGFYPFDAYITAELIKKIPVFANSETFIPLTEISETTFSHWQILYNILIVPITAILLLFHKNPSPERLEFFYQQREQTDLTEEKENDNMDSTGSLTKENIINKDERK